ncbi:MAG: pyridoxal phosphate-dependent aminotransferase [Thermomicrobiales bacterium]
MSSTIAHAGAAELVDERDVLIEIAQQLPDVISLGLGDPDFATPAHIVAAAKEAMREGRCDHYTPPAGLIELRQAIAAKLARENGIIADPETEITITTGGQEGLYAIVQALLDPGDEILVPDPRYRSYDAAIGRAGGLIVPVPTRQEDDFDLRPEEIARRITPRTKAILLVTPGNPTAGVIAPAHLRAIAALAIENDLVVISDEIYERFVFDGAEHFSIGSLPQMRGRTITLNGFSKTYAMTGWRLGYAVAPPALTQAIRALKQAISIAAPTISQWAGVAALNGSQECVAQFRATYDERRRVLMPALDTLGFTYGYPYGAFYIFANIATTGMPAFTLARALLEEARVLIFPGTGFGPAWSDYLRFSFLQPTPILREAVRRVEGVLQSE